MNAMQLDLSFNRLCTNWDKNVESMAGKKAEFLKLFRNVHIDDFDIAVDTVIKDHERFDKFPTGGEMWKYVKRVQKSPIEKKYPECKACDNGIVSIVFGYKLIENKETGEWKDKVVERHHDTLLNRKNFNSDGVRYYTYALACRCECGRDYANRMESASILQEEFEELKHFNSGSVTKEIIHET